jgi:hypothetical protein
MNRTVKEEFGMDRRIKSKEQVKKLDEESVFLCNQKDLIGTKNENSKSGQL